MSLLGSPAAPRPARPDFPARPRIIVDVEIVSVASGRLVDREIAPGAA